MPGRHPFASKAQWRWAFATKQPWAREHAHETASYQALPRRKGRGSLFRRAAARLKGGR